MKVHFPGPVQRTNHPKLGTLFKDKVFDLPQEEAKLYIKAGLLKKGLPSKKNNGLGLRPTARSINDE